MSLHGRRRSGKSWLFRRFAHGKPAVLLVARRTAPGAQLDNFADRLAPLLGVRPTLGSLSDLFRAIHRAGRDQKLLVVIDEFPYLLPHTESEVDRELSAIAAEMEEERDGSQLKLLLCGSLVAQMESLLAERGPLHGRLRPLRLQPVAFAEARLFLPGLTPVDQFQRYAIAGGMPKYLAAIAGPGTFAMAVRERMLNPNAALWDETGVRSSEEIDVVATDTSYLTEIEDFKLPALRQSDLKVAKVPTILLFSRGGYTAALVRVAAERDDVVLIDVPDMLQK